MTMDQAERLRKLVEQHPISEHEHPGAKNPPASPQASKTAKQAKTPKPQKPARTRRPFSTNARVIAVTSGKGGVGKTNFTVNLAIALRAVGSRVMILDADLGMANVDIVLGSSSKKYLLNLLEDDMDLADVLVHGPYGVDFIPGGSGIEKAQTLDDDKQKILLRKLAGVGALADIILIDTGAGLGKNVMDFILAADEVLLVTTPEPTSLTDAYAVMKAYSRYAENPNLQLVVNRIYDERESREVAEKLQQTAGRFLHLDVGCLGYVYEDASVLRAVRRQTPFVVASPDSIAARCIRAMAQGVLYGASPRVDRGWRGFLQRIFHFSR